MKNNNIDFAQIISAVLLLAVIAVLAAIFYQAVPEGAPGASSLRDLLHGENKEQPTPTALPVVHCTSVMTSCKVSMELKTDICREKVARQRLESSMTNPLESQECQEQEQNLANECPLGCRIDYNTMTAIPGKLQTEFSPARDESGQCIIKGKRTITLEASCVPL